MILPTISLLQAFRLVSMLSLVVVSGCGGSGGGGGAQPPGNNPPPADTVFTYDVTLTAAAVTSGSAETGTGTAEVRYNETRGEIEATVTLNGLTADSAAMHLGHAGDSGPVAYSLAAGTTAGTWELGATSIPQGDVAALEAGAIYLQVATAASPDGALRGQVLPPGVTVESIDLDAAQVAPGSTSTATGTAWITLDENAGNVTVHAVTNGLPDADGAVVRRALAGDTGPVVEALVQDTADSSHWLFDTATYTNEMAAAAAEGELYVEFTTATLPDGAIRGQVLPDDFELVSTELESAAVVMASAAVSAASSSGRVMTTLNGAGLTSHANLYGIADVDAVELRQAPAGQNGPLLASFEQDINDAGHWFLEVDALWPSLATGLDNQGVYVNVRTPANPGGVARGQVITESSELPPDVSSFLIESVDPANAAEVTALPDTVVATLNRAPLPASVGPQAVQLAASGGDGSFGDGNEISITPSSVTAGASSVIISLAGVQAEDDVYRVTISGGGMDGIVDTNGIPLDGDADGVPGGVFESAFEVRQPPATLSAIQETIFTPSCATAGCHSGGNPPDGLLLTDGQAYSNIVNVTSVQNSSLFRVEPGNPGDSYLVRKVVGTGIVANRMPLGGPYLTSEEIDLIMRWVTEGAPDN